MEPLGSHLWRAIRSTVAPFFDLALIVARWAAVIAVFYLVSIKLDYKARGWVAFGGGFAAAVFANYLIKSILYRSGSNDGHIRGTRLLSFKDARSRSQKLLRRANSGPALTWGGLTLPNSIAPAGFLAVGDPGYGKTVSIDMLLKTAIARPGSKTSAVIFDPKTDTYCRLKKMGVPVERIVLLNPFDIRSYSWNLGRDLRRAEYFSEIALTLFPKEDTKNPFFETATRDLLEGVLLSFHHKWPMKSRPWSLRDVLLAMGHRPWLVHVLAWHPAANARRIELYFSETTTANNIMSTVSTKIAPYEVLASYWHHAEMAGRTISLEEWSSSDTILVLPHSHRAQAYISAINAVLFKRLSQVILDLPMSSSRRVWVVVDELNKAGKLPMLDELVVKGRDRGVCVVAGFQTIEGLRDVYGPNISGEISNVLGHKAFFGIKGNETAKWAEAVFGNSEVWQTSSSRGASGNQGTWSTSWTPTVKPVVLASQLQAIQRPDTIGRIDGYFFTSGVGPYQHGIPLSSVRRELSPTTDDDSRENFQERPSEQGFLRSWDERELEALRLPPLSLFPKPPRTPPPDEGLEYS